jgi:hypothetical protein
LVPDFIYVSRLSITKVASSGAVQQGII